MVSAVNTARADHGLGRLNVGSTVTSVARNWSAHMASSDKMSHNPNMLDQILSLVPLAIVRENVGHSSGIMATVDVLFAALMNSPGHKLNILATDIDQIAVGCVRSGDHLWVTQNFWG